MKKLFAALGTLPMTWPVVCAFAAIIGIYVGVINQIPILYDTSFRDIAVTYEWWVLFALLIVSNCKSAREAGMKCLVFFLISQPIIHSDESAKVMEADTSPEEYNVKDLVTVFIFLTLFSASATAALWMLRRLFAVLTRCESPFCCEVVNRMRGFGFSLLPAAVFASIGETVLGCFLTAGKSTNVSIQWGVLIAFVVTMALVAVFKYGVQLQKESDETL